MRQQSQKPLPIDKSLLLGQDRCPLLRQMSGVEAGQISAAETGQMSAVETSAKIRQGSALSQYNTSVLSQPVLARTAKLINVC